MIVTVKVYSADAAAANALQQADAAVTNALASAVDAQTSADAAAQEVVNVQIVKTETEAVRDETEQIKMDTQGIHDAVLGSVDDAQQAAADAAAQIPLAASQVALATSQADRAETEADRAQSASIPPKPVNTSTDFSTLLDGTYAGTETGYYNGDEGDPGAIYIDIDTDLGFMLWNNPVLTKIPTKADVVSKLDKGTYTGKADDLDAAVQGKIDSSSIVLDQFANLFDKTNIVEGQSIIDCSIGGNEEYIRTDEIIPVSPGNYCITYFGFTHRLAWYIDGVCQGGVTGITTFDNYQLFTIPIGGNGLRFNVSNAVGNWENNLNTTMLIRGEVYPDHYIPFGDAEVIGIAGKIIKNANKDVYSIDESYNKQQVDALVPTVVISKGKNLFNPNDPDVLLGYYIQSGNGHTSANASYNATGFIPVDETKEYSFSYRNQRAWYDANKVFISGMITGDLNPQTPPLGAKYVRCTVSLASWPTFQLEEGPESTAYEPYRQDLLVSVNGAGVILPESFDANIAMPSRVYALVGQQFNIYYDTFNLLPEYGGGAPNFLIDIVCSKGTMTNRSFQFTPVLGDVGSYALSINFLDNYGNILQSATTTLEVVARTPVGSQKRVLIVADSTWHNGGDNEGGAVATRTLGEILTDIGGTAPIFLGQQQPDPWHNEARSGRTWGTFANGATSYKIYFSGVNPDIDLSNLRQATYSHGASSNTVRLVERWVVNPDGTGWAVGYTDSGTFAPPTSFPTTMTKRTGGTEAAPFPATLTVTNAETITGFSIFKDNDGVGVLNIDYYMQTVLGRPSGELIDILSIDLGINDATNPNTSIENIINNAVSLIGAFQVHNPEIKVIICYPKSKGSDYFSNVRRLIRFTMQKLRKALIAEFDNSSWPNVYLSQSGMGMDRFFGYPIADVSSGIRLVDSGQTFKSTRNDVHPTDYGNRQIGDAVSGLLVKLLNS